MSLTATERIAQAVQRMLLARYAPACIVINQQAEIVYLSGSASRYIESASSAVGIPIGSVLRSSLPADVGTAVHRSIRCCQEVVLNDLLVAEGSSARRIRLVVRPLDTTDDEGLFAMIFSEQESMLPTRAAETLVREAEEHRARLAAIVDSAEDAIVGKTLDGAITSWNAAAERMYGYSAAEAMGQTIDLVVPADKREELREIMRRLAQGQRVNRLETVRVTQQGQRLEVSLNVSPIRDVNGVIIGASAIAHDITARRQVEAQLRKTEHQLRDYLETATLGLHWVGPDGTILWANQAELDLLGYARDEYIGRNISEFHADRAVIDDVLARLSNNELLQEYPARMQRKDGSLVHVLINSSTYWEDDQFVHTRCFTRDVTARVLAERALSESEKDFRALFENAGLGIVQCDAETGRFLRVNPRFCQLIGYSAEELATIGWLDLTHPDEADSEAALFRRLVGGTIPSYAIEKRYMTKEGRVIWAHTTATVTRSEEGQPIRAMAVIEDITLRKSAERELVRARQVAEDASRAKDEFLAVLSHELRTPLTPALGAAALLNRRTDLPEDVQSKIEMIRRNIELEARLIDDLLDLTRITHGKLELKREPISVSALLRRAIEICAEECDARGIRIEVHEEPGDRWVHADPTRVEQVLWNLLKNAIKFSKPGGKVRVESVRDRLGNIVIEVRDHGVGIPEELLSRIFAAFEQGPDRHFGGLGLGLAISQKIIELHGGRITVESGGLGLGATFRVHIPCIDSRVSALPPVSPPTRGRVQRPLSVLIVEDNADTAELLSELLELEGHRVTTTSTAKSAIEIGQSHDFDAIISDLGLPDGTGIDVLQTLRKSGRSPAAIALSGYGMDEDRQRTARAGFHEHIVKPVSPDELLEVLARLTND